MFHDKGLRHNHHVITILHARHLINLIEIELMNSPLENHKTPLIRLYSPPGQDFYSIWNPEIGIPRILSPSSNEDSWQKWIKQPRICKTSIKMDIEVIHIR